MKIFKKRSMNVSILTAFAVLIGLTAIGEVVYSTHSNTSIILKFEKERYSKKIAVAATRWLDSCFEKLEVIIDVLSQSYDHESPNKVEIFERLLLESLKRVPNILSFYVGLSDGNFIQARIPTERLSFRKQKDKPLPSYIRYIVRKIVNEDSATVEKWTYFNEDFEAVQEEILDHALYDPVRREWYIKAELKKEKMWSDPCMFLLSRVPGVTLSKPLAIDKNGKAAGVIAMDFSLLDLKNQLESIKMGPHSKIYLVNSKNEILSSTEKIDVAAKSGASGSHGLSLVKIEAANDALLSTASRALAGAGSEHTTFLFAGTPYVVSAQGLSKLDASILSITPQSDFTDEFKQVQNDMLLISTFIFLLAFAVMFFLSKQISGPIASLCTSAKAIGELDWDNCPPFQRSNIMEIRRLSEAMASLKLSISVFAKYAPKDFVRKLLKHGIEPVLGGRAQEITILFSDIEAFSTISENLPAEYLILHLSEYFEALTHKIVEHNGTIDKYIGDSIMAIWGAPNHDDNHAINACYAALDCQAVVLDLHEKWQTLGKPSLPTRVGIHCGTAVVGNIGISDRMNFTAIGDAVNIAARLEGVNKIYSTKVLVSENVEFLARKKVLFRVIDKVAVKGRTGGVIAFEPLCAIGSADENMYYEYIGLSSKSKDAFELYQNQEFKDALRLYEEIKTNFPDRATAIIPLINKCREFTKKPPEDWDGTTKLTTK
ncbi:MAG: hypothetical protein LBF56_02385 [Holosporales bacterium]|jgi:adenylate cyclase|nr:hypothetical protein [Holosporales bacterium]